MRKTLTICALLLFACCPFAMGQLQNATMNVRYSAEWVNAAGDCGCVALNGGAIDLGLPLYSLGRGSRFSLGAALDAATQHTGNFNGTGTGLTLTTVAGGPRVALRSKHLQPFAQALFGFVHGSGKFPRNGELVSNANSFAFELGAGTDYAVTKLLSVRLVQIDYLRTGLPNNGSDRQNNFRLGAGLTFHL